MQWPELSFTQRMLIAGMVLLTVLRWTLGMAFEISPDEALMAEWGRHPSLVGLHGGSGTAFFAWMSTLAAGWSPFGVRLMAPLLALAASAVLYRLVSSLAGDKAAAWSVALANLTPLWNFAAIFLEPAMPGMLFLLCGMAAVWRALRRASAWDWHWPLAGILFGLGFLCWYGALWGPVSTLILLMASRRWRRQLLRPGPWLMLADVALFAWPVWEWNQAHAMAGWYWFMEQIRPPAGGSLGAPFMLATKWALVLTPLTFAGMVWALVMGLRRWSVSDPARFLTAFAITPLAGAMAASVWGGGHAGWIAPAVPALCGLLPWAWEQIITERLEWKQRFQWVTVLPALMITPLSMDSQVLRHAGVPLPLANDPSCEWRGWRSTCDEFERIVRETGAKTADDGRAGRRLFLIARDTRLASILNFYLPRDLPLRPTSAVHPLVHVPASGLIDSPYHLWPRYDSLHDGKNHFLGCTALYVTDDAVSPDPPLNVIRAFQSFRPVAVFDVISQGETIRRVRVFACLNFSGIPRPDAGGSLTPGAPPVRTAEIQPPAPEP